MPKIKCIVCKKRFSIDKVKKYDVLNEIVSVGSYATYKECYDCTYCGCQNAVNIRYVERKKAVQNDT